MDNFKKINIITRKITNKVFKKYDYNFILVNENWLYIVGEEFYKDSHPISIRNDKTLNVNVKRHCIIDFQYSLPIFKKRIKKVLNNKIVLEIKIKQQY